MLILLYTYKILKPHLIATDGAFVPWPFMIVGFSYHKTFTTDTCRLDCIPTHDARSEYAGSVYAWSW
ncbi:hypothetical protein BDK61_2417 [Haloarcula quadrata]|uniref:Uncharacterized protein n=1 Tax=Haloarcula quadrata TaxID=182779 RepID=A0A495R7M1_9EURY|nr:hypothetical protein BDK61_2417 [Haloarcula quadrata]